MKVSYKKDEILKLVNNCGACMVWGGSLGLAPADDKLIRVEQVLNLESYDKLLISIMAKKATTGIKYLELDLPVGLNSKVKNRKDIIIVKDKFEKLAYQLGIKIDIYERRPKGIDGNAVGPTLEAIEFLKVLEQRSDRSLSLETDAVIISGRLLELSGNCKIGEGTALALSKLQNLTALSKFREIMKNQEGNPNLTSDDIRVSSITKDYYAACDGKIESIINENLVRVTKFLGAPQIKEAGIYFHKNVGDSYLKGEKLLTLYSSSQARLDIVSNSDIEKIIK